MISLLSQSCELRLIEGFDFLKVVWTLCNSGTLLENVHKLQQILVTSKCLNIIHELWKRNPFQRVENPNSKVTSAIVKV